MVIESFLQCPQVLLESYRPMANIPFLSKVIEKAVGSQINLYLETNKLIPPLQSSYRKHQSTETALLRVLDGILTSLDHREDAVLVIMLYLPAAFDTLDHEILIYPGLDPILVSPILFYTGFHPT